MNRTYSSTFSKFLNEAAEKASSGRIPIDTRLDGKSSNKNKKGDSIITVWSAFDINGTNVDNSEDNSDVVAKWESLDTNDIGGTSVYDKNHGEQFIAMMQSRRNNGYNIRFCLNDKTICYDWFSDEVYCEEGLTITPKDKELCSKIASAYFETKSSSIVKKKLDEKLRKLKTHQKVVGAN